MDFIQFLPPNQDLSVAYMGTYSVPLVMLSVLSAVFASFMALHLSGRIEHATSALRKAVWLAPGALALGGGVWAMHFIGMVAFSLPCGISYDPLVTLFSMVPGVLASAVALWVISHNRVSAPVLGAGGVLMGGGIGTMHYSGMAAMRLDAVIYYSPMIFIMSIAFAVALSILALHAKFVLQRQTRELPGWVLSLLGAAFMGTAISGMHYIAMEAAYFIPIDTTPGASPGIAPTTLAIGVGTVTVMVMALTMAAAILARHLETIGELENEIVERNKVEEALRQSKESAEYANHAKSQFLASMSHELRTPLNAIIGFSNMMMLETFGPVGHTKYKEYLDDIHNSGEHLLELITDILDMSKIESGTLQLNESEVDIADAIETCRKLIKHKAADKHIVVYAELPKPSPRIKGDEVRLKQVLINLLTNAVKYTPEDGQITVSYAYDTSGDLSIKVADTGIGMAAEDIPRVMERFTQVADIMSTSEHGVGLGLHLTRMLVEMHGGHLTIDSELGQGTQVTVRLPQERLMA